MTTDQNTCPICGEGHLEEHIGKNSVEYNGQNAELDMLYSVCDVCGSEQSNSIQLRTNKRAMIAFKKQVDGLLSGAEVRALRDRLGINQAAAADIFGGGPVAFSKYEKDDVSQSEAMDKLLRLADTLPDSFSHLMRESGIEHQFESEWTKLITKPQQTKRPVLRIVSSSRPEHDMGWRKTG